MMHEGFCHSTGLQSDPPMLCRAFPHIVAWASQMIATRSCLTLFCFTAALLLRDSLESMATHTDMEARNHGKRMGFRLVRLQIEPAATR